MLLGNERAFEKWLKSEYHNLNKDLVTKKASLADLLKMDEPHTLTRAGNEYQFDIDALKKLGAAIPKLYHRRLELPISFYRDTRVSDSCIIAEKIVAAALQASNDLDPLYNFSKDKLWLSRPLATEIYNKYPTLFQFVVY